jgi:DNA invertase Pin-like site-specific DNA recombinase
MTTMWFKPLGTGSRHIGYALVSTYGQTLNAQLERPRAEGCAKIHREKASGAPLDRRELKSLLKALVPGDVVTVTRIDRLPIYSRSSKKWRMRSAIAVAGGAMGGHVE